MRFVRLLIGPLVGLLLVAIFTSGCEDSPTTLPIDSIVELRAAEDSTGRLTIEGQTQRQYECIGYRIVHRQFMRQTPVGQGIQIDLLGVQRPAPGCPTALAPARMTTAFLMPSIGRHPLLVTANGVASSAFLEVTADSLVVTGGDSTWTLWPEPRVARP